MQASGQLLVSLVQSRLSNFHQRTLYSIFESMVNPLAHFQVARCGDWQVMLYSPSSQRMNVPNFSQQGCLFVL
jgi:hypothetical protein